MVSPASFSIEADQIKLDGTSYRVVGTIDRYLISQFPDKIVVGDTSRQTRVRTSIYAQTSAAGGIGIFTYDPPGDDSNPATDRVYWSTMDLSFPGQMVLAPRADDLPKPAGAGDIKGFEILNSRPYAVFGRDVYSYNGASWSASLHTLNGNFNSFKHVEIDGEDYLAIAHSGGVAYTLDGTVWVDTGVA